MGGVEWQEYSMERERERAPALFLKFPVSPGKQGRTSSSGQWQVIKHFQSRRVTGSDSCNIFKRSCQMIVGKGLQLMQEQRQKSLSECSSGNPGNGVGGRWVDVKDI